MNLENININLIQLFTAVNEEMLKCFEANMLPTGFFVAEDSGTLNIEGSYQTEEGETRGFSKQVGYLESYMVHDESAMIDISEIEELGLEGIEEL